MNCPTSASREKESPRGRSPPRSTQTNVGSQVSVTRRRSPPKSIQLDVNCPTSTSRRKESQSRCSPPRSIQTNQVNATRGPSPPRSVQPNIENRGEIKRSNRSPSRNTHGARATIESTQSSEGSHKQSEKSKSSWLEAGYVPISPMSEEAVGAQLI